MLTVHAIPAGGAGVLIDIQIIVIATSPNGIASVKMQDSLGLETVIIQGGCPGPREVNQTVPGISTYRLPIRIIAAECDPNNNTSGAAESYGPFLGGGQSPHGSGTVFCSSLYSVPASQACLDAQAAASPHAAAAAAACDEARYDRAARDGWAAVAAAAYVAAAAFAAVAVSAAAIPIAGTVIAIILFAIAAIFLGSAIGASISAARSNDRYLADLANFNRERAALREAMMDVRSACCPDQISVQDVSDCTA